MFLVLANIFQPLIDVNEAIINFWHKNVGLGWGGSIVMLTICIRLAILPLTFKSVRSMQALQRLQPEMKKIQERYKDDKQRQQQELMQFYRDHNVNPLGSCLPLVLQFPFFLGLYQTLKSGGQVSKEINASVAHGADPGFLFIPNLTQKATGGVLVALLIIYIATQLTSSYVSAINIQDRNQKILVFAMPLVFAFVVINFPTGLLVYWITTNLFTIAQQLFIRRFLPAPEPLPAGAAAAAGSGGGKGRARAPAGGDGKPEPAAAKESATAQKERPARTKTKAKAGASNGADGGPQKAPPRSPRKKKKRSGRRR
jgi:YidC/Oxa1 family membrane protein insertase